MKIKTFILAALAAIATLLSSCTTSGNECNCPEDIHIGAVQKQYNIVGTWKCEWYEGSSWYEFKGDGTFSDWSLDENNEIQGSGSTGVYSFDAESQIIIMEYLSPEYKIRERYFEFANEDTFVWIDEIYHRVK